MERGPVGRSAQRRAVFWTNITARIRAYYESMPEASQSVLTAARDEQARVLARLWWM